MGAVPSTPKTIKRSDPDLIDWGSSTMMNARPKRVKKPRTEPLAASVARGSVHLIALSVALVWVALMVGSAITGQVANNFWVATVCTFASIACSQTVSKNHNAAGKKAKEAHRRDPLLYGVEYLWPEELRWFERMAAPTVVDQWERAIMAEEPIYIIEERKRKERLAKKGASSEKPKTKGEAIAAKPPKGSAGVIVGGMYGHGYGSAPRAPRGGSGQSPKAAVGDLSDRVHSLEQDFRNAVGAVQVRTFGGDTIATLAGDVAELVEDLVELPEYASCELLELSEHTARNVAAHKVLLAKPLDPQSGTAAIPTMEQVTELADIYVRAHAQAEAAAADVRAHPRKKNELDVETLMHQWRADRARATRKRSQQAERDYMLAAAVLANSKGDDKPESDMDLYL